MVQVRELGDHRALGQVNAQGCYRYITLSDECGVGAGGRFPGGAVAADPDVGISARVEVLGDHVVVLATAQGCDAHAAHLVGGNVGDIDVEQTPWQRILDFGDIQLFKFAAGPILKNINKPYDFADKIEGEIIKIKE